jgi:hypothetical protein
MNPISGLLAALGALTLVYVAGWSKTVMAVRRSKAPATPATDGRFPDALQVGIGAVTNFFDTLGIGSFATTTAAFRLWKLVPDRIIPGTLNVGHTLPTVAQAFIYTTVIPVDVVTLSLFPAGSEELGVRGVKLAVAIGGNFMLGALMTLGIGLYAPCMILVSLLGMNERTAFPIMMGSCAFLMPVGSLRFIREQSYSLRNALGLAIGGIPGVFVAAYIVKSLNLYTVRWLVLIVVVYTAVSMLVSAMNERRSSATAPAEA